MKAYGDGGTAPKIEVNDQLKPTAFNSGETAQVPTENMFGWAPEMAWTRRRAEKFLAHVGNANCEKAHNTYLNPLRT
jgi:hypothetical protein